MNRDNEPIFSEIKPSADDIELRQRQMQARKAAAARAAAAASPPPKATVVGRAKPEGQTQTLGVAALTLVVILAVVAGFLYMQLQTVTQQLRSTQKIIQSQEENLAVLNEKLSVTGENASMSFEQLKSTVAFLDTEVRKLWDLSNKRNRPNIEKNASDIVAINKAIKDAGTSTTASIKQQQSSLDALGKRVTTAEGGLAGMAEVELRLSQQKEVLDSTEKEIAKLKGEITKLKQSGLGIEAADMKLQIEDLNIRIQRLQSAVGG